MPSRILWSSATIEVSKTPGRKSGMQCLLIKSLNVVIILFYRTYLTVLILFFTCRFYPSQVCFNVHVTWIMWYMLEGCGRKCNPSLFSPVTQKHRRILTWTVTGINYPKGTGGDSIWLFFVLFFESFAVIQTYETHTKQLTSLNYLNKQIHQSSGTAMPRRSHLTRGMAGLTIYFVFSLLNTLTEEKSPHYPRMTFTDQGNDKFLFTFKFCCTRTSCSKYGSEASRRSSTK